MSINIEIKARWVAALRSGKYQQAKSALHNWDGGYCCLGVLTDLAVQEGLGEWKAMGDSYAFVANENCEECDCGLLPSVVSEWAGFGYPARMGGEVVIGGVCDMLAGHNDCGRTFEEIAQAIEEQL